MNAVMFGVVLFWCCGGRPDYFRHEINLNAKRENWQGATRRNGFTDFARLRAGIANRVGRKALDGLGLHENHGWLAQGALPSVSLLL